MTLWILNNANSGRVVNDLKTICPDPGLAIDSGISSDGQTRGTGAVTYPSPTMSSVGCRTVQALINLPQAVGIRGETDDWSYASIPGATLMPEGPHGCGGTVVADTYPQTKLLEIVYDIYPCSGRGSWVTDSTGNQIPDPTDVVLFHEMVHALDYGLGTFTDMAASEAKAGAGENEYRTSRSLPLRSGRSGGCNKNILLPPASGPSSRSGCFVATAAYGSPMEPEVQKLRSFRDDVLLRTRAGQEFFDEFWEHYYQVSPAVVRAMTDDPAVKELVRWSIVTPIVRQLELVLAFPDAPVCELDEPWRSFVGKIHADLEAWTNEIELPRTFQGIEVTAAAEEIGVVLRYVLRSDRRRTQYLADLARRGEIPLKGSVAGLQVAGERLDKYGLATRFTEQVVGDLAQRDQRPAVQNVNTDETVFVSALPAPGDWIYQVTVTNLSGGGFDQIALFYTQNDAPNAVVGLFANGVQNGQVSTFDLGPCDQLTSYVIGFFIGSEKVAQIPNSDPIFQGQPHITPALAKQIHPADPPCADGWTIS